MNYVRRIQKEILDLLYDDTYYLYANNKKFCSIDDIEDIDTREIYCNIRGPDKSPYKNGIFKICIKIPDNYPYDPPIFKFITPIYHPNLYSEDYLDIYNKNDWAPSLTIKTIILEIYSLMLEPNIEFTCNNQNNQTLAIQKVFKNNNFEWKNTATEWTMLYATKQFWSLFNHKTITNNEQHNYIIYILWLGKHFINNINTVFSDLWTINIMPYIVDKVGSDIITRKNPSNYYYWLNSFYQQY